MQFRNYFSGFLRKPLLTILVSALSISLGAAAGSLTPGSSPAGTMHTLAELYNAIADTFDSSAVTANQNGSLLQNLKYIDSQIVWASGSSNIWSLNTGNVGIGETGPEQKLSVAGNIIASSSASTLFQLVANNEDDASFALRVSGNAGSIARLDFLGSASQIFMTIASSGNIGINNTTPAAQFYVLQTADTVHNGIRIVNSNAIRALNLWVDSDNVSRIDSALPGDQPLALNADGGGNVGIGTTNPQSALHVASGDIIGNGDIVASSSVLGDNSVYLSGYDGGINITRTNGPSGGAPYIGFSNNHTADAGFPDFQLTEGLGNFYIISSDSENDSFTFAKGAIARVVGANPQFTLSNGRGGTNEVVDFIISGSSSFAIHASASSSGFNMLPDGNVGIGTTSPISRVHLVTNGPTVATQDDITIDTYGSVVNSAGAINGRRARGTLALPTAVQLNDELAAFGGSGYNGSSFVVVGGMFIDADSDFSSSVLSSLRFETYNGTSRGERMRISPVGNVGIGETSPEQALDVKGSILASASANAALILNSLGTGLNEGKFSILASGAAGVDSLIIRNGTGRSLLTIASSGYVGIGTTIPAGILQVVNPSSTGGGNGGAGTPTLLVTSSQNESIFRVFDRGRAQLNNHSSGAYPALTITTDNQTPKGLVLSNLTYDPVAKIASGFDFWQSDDGTGNITVGSDNIAYTFAPTSADFRVKSYITCPNCSIGGYVNAAAAGLVVWGDDTIQSVPNLVFGNSEGGEPFDYQFRYYYDTGTFGLISSISNTVGWRMSPKGYVGLGTSGNPKNIFEVGNGDPVGSLASAAFAIYSNTVIGNVASISAYNIGSGNIFSITAPTVGFTGNILQARNFDGGLIAELSGAGNLELAGYASISSEVYVFGNVGIGTSNPQYRLEIGTPGDINLASSGAGYRIGDLRILHTKGSSNVFVGAQAGESVGVGSANAALGFQALFSNGGGTGNAAVGSQALYSNTIGAYNIALGPTALYSNTEGNLNVAIGRLAMFNNTIGTSNVAVGDSAMNANVGGIENVALGNSAGSIASGSYNTYLGAYSGAQSYKNINFSVAIGYTAQVFNSNQIVVGSPVGYISEGFFGSGVSMSGPIAFRLNASGGQSLNNGGASLSFAGGRGTGTALGGAIIFQTASASAVSSGDANPLTTRMTIAPTGYIGIGIIRPKSKLFILDSNAGVVASSSFGIRSALTLGSVASISATSLAGGTVFNLTLPASSSANNPHGLLLARDVNGVTIASWSMGGKLAIAGKILSDGANSSCTGVNVGGPGCIDYAESFPASDATIMAGELVAVDPASTAHVIRATASSAIIGIVSTNPAALITGIGFLSGSATRDTAPNGAVPVALAGRVPVKISTENGIITAGDHLTVSSTIPGFAMKQTAAGMSVGVALESSADSVATVLTYVNTSYWAPEVPQVVVSEASDSFFTALVQKFAELFHIIFSDGLIQTHTIRADTLCAGDTCVTQNQLQELLQRARIDAASVPTPTPISTPSDTPTPIATEIPTPTPEITATPETPSPTELVIPTETPAP